MKVKKIDPLYKDPSELTDEDYLYMLNYLVKEGVFSEEEAEKMRKVLEDGEGKI